MTPRIERLVLPSGRIVLIETRHYKDFDTVSYRLTRQRMRKPAKRKAGKRAT